MYFWPATSCNRRVAELFAVKKKKKDKDLLKLTWTSVIFALLTTHKGGHRGNTTSESVFPGSI